MPILGVIASSTQQGRASDFGAYEPISAITVPSTSTASVTFASIPSTYAHLQIRVLSRSDRAATAQNIYLQFNGDAGANYTLHALEVGNTTVSAAGAANTTYLISGVTTGTSASSNIYAGSVIDILDSSSTNKFKTVRTLSGFDLNNTSSGVNYYSGSWRSSSAVTSVTLLAPIGNFIQYSTFALYGIKGN